MAEREGFEPSVGFYPHTRLAGEHHRPTRSSLRRLAAVAEGVGFEPTELSFNGFQDRRLKPLGHPSNKVTKYHFTGTMSIISSCGKLMKKRTESTTGNQVVELNNLACLYEITKHLASAHNLQDCLEKVVATLDREKDMTNGTVTIINPNTGELEIEVAHGITAEARRRGKYKVGEGITGKVVVTGEPILVPQIGEEPLFLNRTRTRGDEIKKKSSFLCVPIKVGNNVSAPCQSTVNTRKI
jgi:hypothetical protein